MTTYTNRQTSQPFWYLGVDIGVTKTALVLGRGCRHLIFLTHGTGMGAGLILSSGGIARLARLRNRQARMSEIPEAVTARDVFNASSAGDDFCTAIVEVSSTRLAQALVLLVDTLNTKRIIMSSLFVRSEAMIRPAMERALRSEALPANRRACQIIPAELGEVLGDHIALFVAAEALNFSQSTPPLV